MNNPLGLIVVLAFMVLSIACSETKDEKKTSRQEVLLQTDTVRGSEVKQLCSQTVDKKVNFKKKDYQIHIKREADNSLSMIQTEEGETFKDNTIHLLIKSSDGRVLFDKVFRKDFFSSMVEARFMPYTILDGLAFDRVSEKGFHFVAGVSYPQSDFYVPVSILVSPEGKLSMSKAEFMENTNTEE